MSRKSKEVTFTLATATSPAMSEGETEKQQLHLSPAEFGQQLSALSKQTKDLVKIALKVGALKSGQHLVLSNGEKMGRKELNNLVSRHNKTLKQLKKNYGARGTRKKRDTSTRPRADGFAKGSFLKQPLLDFIQNANFGGVNGPQGGQDIREVLAPLVENALLSRSILTILFTIYEFSNGLRFEQDGKKYFKAGPEMVRHLGPYLSQLEASDRALSDEQLLDAKGNMKPRFDRNRFVYNRLQSIVKPGLFATNDLDDDRKAYIDNQQVKDTLKDVQAVLSRALKLWNPAS